MQKGQELGGEPEGGRREQAGSCRAEQAWRQWAWLPLMGRGEGPGVRGAGGGFPCGAQSSRAAEWDLWGGEGSHTGQGGLEIIPSEQFPSAELGTFQYDIRTFFTAMRFPQNTHSLPQEHCTVTII